MALLPKFVEPQLSLLVDKAPSGSEWVHEIKFDGYRIAARLKDGKVDLLTRSGLNWTSKYAVVAAALGELKVRSAYLDGELCALLPDGTTSFAGIQAATDGSTDQVLTYFAFDLLHLDGRDLRSLPLLERKKALAALLKKPPSSVRYSEHVVGNGSVVHKQACAAQAEGIISKQADAPYVSGDRGKWLKVKCHQRAEFVVIGYSQPEGSRPYFGALLLGYYDDHGNLAYAGRVGGGFSDKKLAEVFQIMKPLVSPKMPLDMPPPKKTRFGSPLELSRVTWLKPKLVAEVRFISWTGDGLLRHTVFEGLRKDKKAKDVRRELPVKTTR